MKKLIVLATLAALPVAAMADVVISGDIGVSLVNSKSKDNGAKSSANDMNRQTGQIVFSGSEDLGNGLKAIWQVANRVDASGDETNSWGGRDTFVGVQSAFGKVRMGKLSNPTNSGYSRLEPFNELSIHGDGVGADGELRTTNTIRFDSANYNGFEFAVTAQLRPEGEAKYGWKDHDSDPSTGEIWGELTSGKKYSNGLGVKYNNGPLAVVYSRAVTKSAAVGKESDKATVDTARVEYAFGDLGLGLGYAAVKDVSGGEVTKERGYGVTATYAMGALTPKASFWKEGKEKTDGVDTAGTFSVWTVGVDYALSKRTAVGAEFQSQGARITDFATGEKEGKKQITAVYLTHAF